MFEQMVVSRKTPKTRRPWSVAVAIILQALVVIALIIIPLLFTEALPKTMLGTFLTAPPPPAPPPPPAAVVKQTQQPKIAQLVKTHAMVAPTVIPKKIEAVNEAAPPQVQTNTGAGVPGGIGDTMGGLGTAPAPPPPPKAAPQRIQVGGNVESAKLIRKVTPAYPPIARSAHISGTVVLHAVIAKNGMVQQLQFVSGPALLMASAMDAVREWRYEPTELNGQPVEVDTTIQVVYSLG